MKSYESIDRTCLICDFTGRGKLFSNHIRKEHGLKSKEYTIIHLYDNKKPKCLECGDETRYVAFGFKRYCKKHALFAEKEGGKKGGKAPAWSKGFTKETDERVMKFADKLSGKGNPFYVILELNF